MLAVSKSNSVLATTASVDTSNDYEDNLQRDKLISQLTSSKPVVTAEQDKSLECFVNNAASFQEPSTRHTLVIITPDVYHKKETIIQHIQNEGFAIVKTKDVNLTLEQAREFYSSDKQKSNYNKVTRYMSSSAISALLLEKEDAVQSFRSFMGPSNHKKAKKTKPKSIRAMFGKDAAYASESDTDAQKDAKFFFGDSSPLKAGQIISATPIEEDIQIKGNGEEEEVIKPASNAHEEGEGTQVEASATMAENNKDSLVETLVTPEAVSHNYGDIKVDGTNVNINKHSEVSRENPSTKAEKDLQVDFTKEIKQAGPEDILMATTTTEESQTNAGQGLEEKKEAVKDISYSEPTIEAKIESKEVFNNGGSKAKENNEDNQNMLNVDQQEGIYEKPQDDLKKDESPEVKEMETEVKEMEAKAMNDIPHAIVNTDITSNTQIGNDQAVENRQSPILAASSEMTKDAVNTLVNQEYTSHRTEDINSESTGTLKQEENESLLAISVESSISTESMETVVLENVDTDTKTKEAGIDTIIDTIDKNPKVIAAHKVSAVESQETDINQPTLPIITDKTAPLKQNEEKSVKKEGNLKAKSLLAAGKREIPGNHNKVKEDIKVVPSVSRIRPPSIRKNHNGEIMTPVTRSSTGAPINERKPRVSRPAAPSNNTATTRIARLSSSPTSSSDGQALNSKRTTTKSSMGELSAAATAKQSATRKPLITAKASTVKTLATTAKSPDSAAASVKKPSMKVAKILPRVATLAPQKQKDTTVPSSDIAAVAAEEKPKKRVSSTRSFINRLTAPTVASANKKSTGETEVAAEVPSSKRTPTIRRHKISSQPAIQPKSNNKDMALKTRTSSAQQNEPLESKETAETGLDTTTTEVETITEDMETKNIAGVNTQAPEEAITTDIKTSDDAVIEAQPILH